MSSKRWNAQHVIPGEWKEFRLWLCHLRFQSVHSAHHWADENEVAVGHEVMCIYGNPSNKKCYTLKIETMDQKVDYCILERLGDAPFPEWLETNASPNLRVSLPVFLAAYQIGVQKDLDAYDMEPSLGVTSGMVMKTTNRHFLHSCCAFKGDSGGAIVIGNGQVIGIHIASVNEAEDMLNMSNIDLGSIENSINQLTHSHYSGSIALRLSAIEVAQVHTE
jgi:hypothetical protein